MPYLPISSCHKLSRITPLSEYVILCKKQMATLLKWLISNVTNEVGYAMGNIIIMARK